MFTILVRLNKVNFILLITILYAHRQKDDFQ